VELDLRDAERPVERPGLDVDVLHPAVRHDDELPEHHAAADEQVVLALGVPDRGGLPAGEQPAPDLQRADPGEDRPRPRPVEEQDADDERRRGEHAEGQGERRPAGECEPWRDPRPLDVVRVESLVRSRSGRHTRIVAQARGRAGGAPRRRAAVGGSGAWN
jgi:hypothetical protein